MKRNLRRIRVVPRYLRRYLRRYKTGDVPGVRVSERVRARERDEVRRARAVTLLEERDGVDHVGNALAGGGGEDELFGWAFRVAPVSEGVGFGGQ